MKKLLVTLLLVVAMVTAFASVSTAEQTAGFDTELIGFDTELI